MTPKETAVALAVGRAAAAQLAEARITRVQKTS